MPFDKQVYRSRRLELAERIGEGIAVIPTAKEKVRNADNMFPFRPDSSFYYLTGFNEPEAVLVIAGGGTPKSILFCREKNAEAELWEGERLGPKQACSVLGVDKAYPIEAMDTQVAALIEENQNRTLFIDFDNEHAKECAPRIKDLSHALAEMRLRKGPEEIEMMHEAACISAQAHREAMQGCRSKMMEYELEAILTSYFRREGGDPLHAYPPIVAGGNNACTLHYVKNNQELRDGDLVLIDAGCELDGYASDITRTFPVRGRFTGEQKAIYKIVLEAQKAAVDQVRPGKRYQKDADEAALRIIVEGLKSLGIPVENLRKRFYPHKIGHWLGLDVHDVGDYEVNGQPRALAPGMVVTIEPGIYIPEGTEDVHPIWHGIGVRIEDDVLVTEGEPEVLSRGAPKEVDEIEEMMQNNTHGRRFVL